MGNIQISIQTKMSVMLIFFLTTLLSLYGVYQYMALRSAGLSRLNELADSVIVRLAENLSMPMWGADDLQVEKVVLSELREKNIQSIFVKDEKGRILTNKGRDPLWQIINLQEVPLSSDIARNAPIEIEGRNLGSVVLSMTTLFMQADLHQAIKTVAMTIVLLDAVLFVALILSVRQMLIRPLALLLANAETLAKGDFNCNILIHQHDEIGALANAFRAMTVKFIDVVHEVKDAVNTIVRNTSDLSSSAQTLSQGTSQQAAATEEVSSSMEEMSANIRQNAEHARQTESLAKQSVAYAEESGKVVAETAVAMQQIVDQISTIQDIAQQTRLLSLNATIESSRAQDYGKAFAVVAHEVRDLANTTRIAAETIVKLANSTLDVSQRAGEMLMTLVPNIQKTAELVMEISAASAEQSSGVEQINRAVQQLDQVTQMNASSAEEIASASEVLAKQAEQLQDTIAFFTLPETSKVEQIEEDQDVLHALQTLAAKGASEHALGALVKSLLATPQARPTERRKHEEASSSQDSPNHEPDMSPTTPLQDTLDEEFEHY